MAYFIGARGALPPRFAQGVKLRVDNGGTYLGSLYSFIQSRYPGYTAPKTTTAPTMTTPTAGFTAPFVQTAPAPVPTTVRLSPAPPPTPTPTPAPTPSYTPPPPQPQPSDPLAPTPPSSSGGAGAGAIAQAAAPIVGAIDPAAGAAAALLPAFSAAAGAPDTSRIRFSDDSATMPDATGPEVYNADGTPVTTSAKVATIAEKIKALPPAAKIGGAVVLYMLFSRR